MTQKVICCSEFKGKFLITHGKFCIVHIYVVIDIKYNGSTFLVPDGEEL